MSEKTVFPGVIIEDDNSQSGIIIPIVNINGEECLLFEVRSTKLKGQPGDICFPGGRIEPGESPLQAAKRECLEELLINDNQIEILGPTTILKKMRMVVYPYVARLHDYNDTFNEEVSEVFTVPLKFFRDTKPDIYEFKWQPAKNENFPYDLIYGGRNYAWNGNTEHIIFYNYQNHIIWGMTAKIIYYAFLRYAAEEYDLLKRIF